MLILDSVSLTLGDKTLFNDFSCALQKDQRVGLVGRNGSGKSTLLKVIHGSLACDQGTISIEKNKKIAYMPQEVVLLSSKTVFDETLSIFEQELGYKREYEDILKKSQDAPHELSSHELDRLGELALIVGEISYERLEDRVHKVLDGLGFLPAQKQASVEQLSVGWKMRLVLAKLLLQDADFYLFDEPTNHLDIVAKDWFLDFLQNAAFGFLLVCHDRYFLDHLCTHIIELAQGKARLYRGNYTTYVTQKEKEREITQAAYEEQQRMIKRKMQTIERFRAKATKASMAQSMLKALEKVERIEIEKEQGSISMSFPNVERAGQIVLTVRDVKKTFGDCCVFDHISFEVLRGERAALVAANGKGKTTLLNLISGKYVLEQGVIKLGHNVSLAVFEQDQERSLNPENTVLEEVEQMCTTSEMRLRVRGLLGAFLFPGDDVFKKIRVLSGGEKNRVAMVKVLLLNANVLILDEPTNHLDIQSKEILLQALRQYPGTILFVSHDRSFLDSLANRIFELTPHKIISYKGNYESYLYQKHHQEVRESGEDSQAHTHSHARTGLSVPQKTVTRTPDTNTQDSKQDKKQEEKDRYELRKKITNLERKIERCEQERDSLYKQYDQGDTQNDGFVSLNKKVQEVQQELEKLYDSWEALQRAPNKNI